MALSVKEASQKTKVSGNLSFKKRIVINMIGTQNRVLAGNYIGQNFRQDDVKLIQADNNLVLRQILSGKKFGTTGNDIIELNAALKKLGRKTIGVNYPPD
ncbi:hypothetical protein ACHRV1_25975 [Flavobacterium aquidurense]|uniref:hypothetical protein n=1 Tax=Flavobacterium TaxID=237 RepID=UPI003756D2EA